MSDDSQELTEKEKSISSLLKCPKCKGPRIPVSHGVACETGAVEGLPR